MQESNIKPSELTKLNLDSAEKLNRIRDLIFGQQSRELEQKLERQRLELARLSQESTRLGETVRALESSFAAQLNALSARLSAQIEEQHRHQSQLLKESEQRLEQQLQSVNQHLLEQVATLSQALHLINGDTIQGKISQGGVVKQLLDGGRTPQQVIESLYVRTLARRPTPEEVEKLMVTVTQAENPQVGLEDVFWAILNSREFLFNH